MVFLTNNFAWAPSTVADLYKHRWSIEAFFKQIKTNNGFSVADRLKNHYSFSATKT